MGLPAPVASRVRDAHGEAALAALEELVAAQPVALEVRGPVWWVAVGPKVLARPHFFVDGGWRVLVGPAAFAQALAASLPPLAPWEPIVKAWAALTSEDVLVTAADVADAADPGFNLFPLSLAARQRWEPPAVVDGVLRFMSVRHATVHLVQIDERSLAVEVARLA